MPKALPNQISRWNSQPRTQLNKATKPIAVSLGSPGRRGTIPFSESRRPVAHLSRYLATPLRPASLVRAGLIQGIYAQKRSLVLGWLNAVCPSLQNRKLFLLQATLLRNDAFLAYTADARSEFGNDPQDAHISPMLSTYVLSPPYIRERRGRASWPAIPCITGGLPTTLPFVVIMIRCPKRDLPLDPFSLFQVALFIAWAAKPDRQGSLGLKL